MLISKKFKIKTPRGWLSLWNDRNRKPVTHFSQNEDVALIFPEKKARNIARSIGGTVHESD